MLPKVVAACGLPLTFAIDGESLRKNNKDIGHDQTDGANECNEPLRLLWYACKTDAGKAAVKAAFDPARLLNPDKAIPTLARCAEYGKMHVRRGLLPFADIPRF